MEKKKKRKEKKRENMYAHLITVRYELFQYTHLLVDLIPSLLQTSTAMS